MSDDVARVMLVFLLVALILIGYGTDAAIDDLRHKVQQLEVQCGGQR